MIDLLVLLLITASSAFAADTLDETSHPFLESIEGATSITVSNKTGTHQAGEGFEFSDGDRIETGPMSTARVVYPGGSALLVAQASELEIEPDEEGANVTNLRYGHLQAIISKTKGAPAKHRFIIKTPVAALGVRGTEFMVDHDSDAGTEVHTLEGQVDVAQNRQDLRERRGFLVERDQFLQAHHLRGLQAPRKFDRGQFARQWTQRHPHLAKLRQRPARAFRFFHRQQRLSRPQGKLRQGQKMKKIKRNRRWKKREQ